MNYDCPIMEIILFEKENVIRTSLTGEGAGSGDGVGGSGSGGDGGKQPWE